MRTTRPILKDETGLVLRTPRLLLRPPLLSDLEAYHLLRSDPITMLESISGIPDDTPEKSLEFLERWLPPNNLKSFLFSVFLVDAEASGPDQMRYIGNMGIHNADVPEIGYMFMRMDWGRGYATEAMRAILDAYWKLERKEVEVEDDWPELKPYQTVGPDGSVREGLRAMIEVQNHGSRRVLEKGGFKLVEGKEFIPEPDHRGPAKLVWYYLERPLE